MSKENVVFFCKAISEQADLEKMAQSAETAEEWVKIAHDAGYEFSVEDLASVVGTTLGRPVNTKSAVREYRAAELRLGALELSQKAQTAILGGRRYAQTNN